MPGLTLCFQSHAPWAEPWTPHNGVCSAGSHLRAAHLWNAKVVDISSALLRSGTGPGRTQETSSGRSEGLGVRTRSLLSRPPSRTAASGPARTSVAADPVRQWPQLVGSPETGRSSGLGPLPWICLGPSGKCVYTCFGLWICLPGALQTNGRVQHVAFGAACFTACPPAASMLPFCVQIPIPLCRLATFYLLLATLRP